MRKRLNGWQRIWVVAAALGFFYAAYFALDDAYQQYKLDGNVLLAYDDPRCKAIVDLPAGFKLDQSPGMDSPCWHLYLYRSIYEDARNTRSGYAEHMGSLQRKRALATFGFTLIVWILAAALLYAVGATIAWVRRGFRAPT